VREHCGVKTMVQLAGLGHRWVCPAADCESSRFVYGQWAAANCATLPTANVDQYATLRCKLLLFWFPCKQRYINVRTFNVLTFDARSPLSTS